MGFGLALPLASSRGDALVASGNSVGNGFLRAVRGVYMQFSCTVLQLAISLAL